MYFDIIQTMLPEIRPSLLNPHESLRETIKKYCALPHYGSIPGLLEKQAEIQTIYNENAQGFYETNRDNAWSAAQANDYTIATKYCVSALKQLDELSFSDHDKKAIRLLLTRRLGRVYEHWATFGLEHEPLENPVRQKKFVAAAFLYMQADFELGGITEYAGRAGEALRGAQLFNEGNDLIRAFWGLGTIITSDPVVIAENIADKKRGVSEKNGACTVDTWSKYFT